MKKLILFSFCALALAVAFTPSKAVAGDEYKAALSANDAGTSNSASMSPRLNYSLQCRTESCYHTGSADPLAADCDNDFVLAPNGTAASDGNNRRHYQRDFQAGTHTKIVARALDGGNPDCHLYQSHRNP